MIYTFTAISSLPGVDRLTARPLRCAQGRLTDRLTARPHRPERVAGAFPGGDRLRLVGEAESVEAIHQPHHLADLVRDRLKLRPRADVGSAANCAPFHGLIELVERVAEALEHRLEA